MSKENEEPEGVDPFMAMLFQMMFGEQMARAEEMMERDKKIIIKLGNEEPITLYDFVMKYGNELEHDLTEKVRNLEVGETVPVPDIFADVTRIE